MKTLWQHCNVASMASGVYSIIEDAAMVTSGAHIEWIGPRAGAPARHKTPGKYQAGAGGNPGVIDLHT
ncbi:imidazolonepropionase, partial [Pseudomonas protegens]